ncbi:MAG: DUF362 domain-containing protein [Methanocalculus sp. MSAO_Arc1]|uniref:DUF362 domain-containing protein n=1 Tax=Methanocalculus TaxID=71151 RepID=UPI000FF04736|nr:MULTISPECIES: DUF362 domain-containing protein [unclassified Methanocalculus]MCP1662154.1 uncharacterized protein (DUF362 family) [Methanocalculus sp. AMF5]RQD79115.1 MAG: DUF362 domain-containing protein [Methanocalculus sp. MSAO_Arc1]
MQPVFVSGIQRGSGEEEVVSAARSITLKATDDLSWLSKGDTVLLKPALNSSFPYPSTTDPLAVRAVADLLTERGAEVVIGDQSGIEHVLHHPGGVLRGSTTENFIASGMNRRDGRRFIGFEDEGWEDGFFHHKSEQTRSWKNGYSVTHWVKTADHIISLPRISTHSMTGATLGLKNMVGLLREDSRVEFHANGPMNKYILKATKGSTLSSVDDGTGAFFEKIVEISDVLREKLRLTLFSATLVQATFGPDRYSIESGPIRLGKAAVVRPDPGLLIASTDIIAAEAAALAVLKEARQTVPWIQRFVEKMALFGNPCIRSFDQTPVSAHPAILHGIRIGLGEIPEEIIADDLSAAVAGRIRDLLRSATVS